MLPARQYSVPANRLDGLDDFRFVGRDENGADFRFGRTAPDMDDHRLAADVCERLAGQAGRGHARGNEDDRSNHERLDEKP